MSVSTPFSVAMSVYHKDNAEFFDRAMASITSLQSVMPEEIVLVADGPLNDTLDAVIKKYEALYPAVMTVVRLPENKGLGNALKVATETARNELVARMDSDDVSLPSRFSSQLSAFEGDPSLDIIGGDISEFVDEEENIVAQRRVPVTNEEIYEYMKTRCPLNHVSVMFKKSAVTAAGGYLDLFWNEDYYLWIRMAEKNAKMANTGTVLVNVRTGRDMYRRRGGKPYFKSEKFLQKYMRERKMISRRTYLMNVAKRFIVQRMLPNRLRGWVFRTFARR